MGREAAFFLTSFFLTRPDFVFLGTRRVLGLCQSPLQARPLLRQAGRWAFTGGHLHRVCPGETFKPSVGAEGFPGKPGVSRGSEWP